MAMTEINGGMLIVCKEDTLPLPEKTQTALLKKWEYADEDNEVSDMLKEAAQIAAPKGYIKKLPIDAVNEDKGYVVLDGIRFDGTLLTGKLKPLFDGDPDRRFVTAFVCTCGRELHDWALANDDVLLRSVADDICVAYMHFPAEAIHAYAQKAFYGDRQFSAMNPGSLSAWDLKGQIPLFAALGEGAEKAGVTLTATQLMIPFKSGSGIYFETEHSFESCMHCEKSDCPNRRAAFVGKFA